MVLSEAQFEKDLLPGLHDCWQYLILASYETEGLIFLQTVTSTPCYKAFSTGLLLSSKSARERVCFYDGYYNLTYCIQVYIIKWILSLL